MPLPIEQLTAFGLSQQAVNAWRASGISHLLPLQEKALAEHGFLHGKNLLLFAPTSSGKTFVAEIAALRHLEQNRRVIYLVPTKALAEEKYAAFTRLYGPLGYRIAVSTRERPDTDGVVLEGRYDFLVAVYEKMKAYLVAQPEILAGVALLVADEIQMLGEPDRGATIDLLLTKISHAPYKTQFIGLSAVLGEDAARIASWLKSDLMVHRERPLELREGVFDFSRNVFRHRSFNTGEWGEELLAREIKDVLDDAESEGEEPADFRREAILSLARELAVERHEQVIIFVPTRYVSRNWAHHLASQVQLPPAQAVLDEIERYEDTHSRDLLREVLESAVAFHNADLSWDLRMLIEKHFNSGAIRILVSTSTLGQGVNLTGRNVLHVPVMVSTDPWTGRNAMVSLSRSRYRNQGGRGARFGHEIDFGRSILIARNSMEAERLLRDYVEGETESLTPRLNPESLDAHLLDLVASRAAVTPAELAQFFLSTFSGRTLWQADSAPIARRIEEATEALIRDHLLARTGDARESTSRDGVKLTATGIGEVTAMTGLQTATVKQIVQWLREIYSAAPASRNVSPIQSLSTLSTPRSHSSFSSPDLIEPLLVLASTSDGRDFPIGAAGSGESSHAWVTALRDRLAETGHPLPPTIEDILSPPGGMTRESLLDFKKTLVLDAWIGPGDTRDIEEAFQVYSGTITNLAGHFAWLAEAAAALAHALIMPADFVKALHTLAERLVLGCGIEGMGLRSLRVQGLSRAYLQTLLRDGYNTIPALAAAKPEDLARLIPEPVARETIAEAWRMTHPNGPKSRKVSKDIKDSGDVKGEKDEKGLKDRGHKKDEKDETEKDTRDKKDPKNLKEANTSAFVTHHSSLITTSDPHPFLEIDLRGIGRLVINGREARLPRLAFRLLSCLARSPQIGVRYEDLEQYIWPDAQVERQQVLSHRKRAVNALAPFIGAPQAEALIEISTGTGLCLNLPPEQIRILEP